MFSKVNEAEIFSAPDIGESDEGQGKPEQIITKLN